MGATTHSIDINAPLSAVYNQWTQFEEFPRFMEGVEEVRQDGPRNLFWKARIAGKEKQWEAEILEQIPDQRIVWQSIDGTPNSGEVTFERVDEERTRVILTMEYEPEGFLEKAGDVLGIPSGRAEGDLKRFRDFIEERGTETGGWNERIEPKETPESISPDIQAKPSPIVEDTYPTKTVSPDREIVHSPGILPIDPEETKDFGAREAEERSTRLADVPSPAETPLVGAADEPRLADEPRFYQDTASRPTPQEIAERAYEIHLERGQAPGHEVENWLQAEKELSEKLGATGSKAGVNPIDGVDWISPTEPIGGIPRPLTLLCN
jgi:uncharacterized protein YndB with AHSA1/START domain